MSGSTLQVAQLLIQRIAYLTPMNLVVVILYVLSLLVTFNTQSFHLAHLHDLTKEVIRNESEVQYLEGLAHQTGLRQVRYFYDIFTNFD